MAEDTDVYETQRRRKAAERGMPFIPASEIVAGAIAIAGDPGEPDGEGWYHRERPDGSIEWREEGKPWPPDGWEYAIDSQDRAGLGGPKYTPAGAPVVAKLRRIVEGPTPTHPPRAEPVHYSSNPGGVRYGS
jgi:hypothetical protein